MKNMHSIHYYIASAMKVQRLKYQSDLALMMGVTASVLSAWKKGVYHPHDHYVVDLAKLGDNDEMIAIMDAEIWRAEGAPHTAILQNMRQIIQSAAAVFLLAITLSFGGDTLAETPA